MKKSWVGAVIIAGALAAGCGQAEEGKSVPEKKTDEKAVAATDQKTEQTTCPVMEGGKINKKLYVDANGKRIYVCCGGCIAEVKKDPAKYIEKLEKAGVVLEKAPEKEADKPKE